MYLDHTGTTLFPKSALDDFVQDVTSNLYGNPHSESKSSRRSTTKIEEIRKEALQFFNANPKDFDLVFVQNATAAIKLVVEIFQSDSGARGGFWYGYHADSHTSLVGVREVAGAGFSYFASDAEVEDWITTGNVSRGQSSVVQGSGLFAYPGQSNMTGRRLPLSWPGKLRQSGLSAHKNTYTLLDAAALAATSELDLSNADEAPDFVALSFYKIFGFPDLGALLVRRTLSPMLQRRKYFGGGTVEMVVNDVVWQSTNAGEPHEYLEDGTLPFHNIIALGHALNTHRRLYTSQKLVSRHTARLARYMYDEMSALQHWDGSPICVIYKEPDVEYGDTTSAGSTIAFNLRYIDGTWVNLSDVELKANKYNIHLRTGGVCNPGGIAGSLKLSSWELMRNYVAGVECGHGPAILGGKPSGIVRVSLGAMSNKHDVDRLVDFLRSQFRNLRSAGTPDWECGVRAPISQMMIYPLAGARAWRTPAESPWPMCPRGLTWDRGFFLIDLVTLEVLTREVTPQLMLLYPKIDMATRQLKISLHRSLRHRVKLGLDHICLPLERLGATNAVDPVGCHICSSKKHYLSTHVVKYRHTSTSAQMFFSDDIVGFFSFAIGRPCTVARMSDLGLGGEEDIKFPQEGLHRTVVVEEGNSPPLDVNNAIDTPAVPEPQPESDNVEWQPSPYEGLAESLEANVVLSETPHSTGVKDVREWLFMRIGRRFFIVWL